MFDPTTTELIRTAPQLEELDIDTLPVQLTEAFANIVLSRIRLRNGDEKNKTLADRAFDTSAATIRDDEENKALVEMLHKLHRLAVTYEAYASLLPDRKNRAAAAFVAASAHQAVLLESDRDAPTSFVEVPTVSPDICAALLFLIAEAHTDAAKMAKRIRTDPNSSAVECALVLAIHNLAQGQLDEIDTDSPEISVAEKDLGARALEALQLQLWCGVSNLAHQLRMQADIAPEDDSVKSAAAIFAQVRTLCVESIEGIGDKDSPVFSLYPGPLHLANLLLGVESSLVETALIRIKTPKGVPDTDWRQILHRMAQQHPYLWRNHCQAIQRGYLEQGVSSAISFPTGSGKSMLAELKVATALLRGDRVVFLAPTHALVRQTLRSLRQTFKNHLILADADEDINIDLIRMRYRNDRIVFGDVMVMTPGHCLMLLSMYPEAFDKIGLIVFDECHLLHPRKDDRDRRGLDAMLAILNLTQIAPSADLLLLSGMMENTKRLLLGLCG